jgi:hypothetical protein
MAVSIEAQAARGVHSDTAHESRALAVSSRDAGRSWRSAADPARLFTAGRAARPDVT